MLNRDGQLKRMRVKDSYLLEKQKQLGDFFSEEDWTENNVCEIQEKEAFDEGNDEDQGVVFKTGSHEDDQNEIVREDGNVFASTPITDTDQTTPNGGVHHRTPVLASS